MMFSLFAMGFAQIKAEAIPEGIMPKRQAAGTGVSTTTTADSTTDTTQATSATDAPSSTTQETSATSAATTPSSTDAPTTTSDATTPSSTQTTAAPSSTTTTAASTTEDSSTTGPSASAASSSASAASSSASSSAQSSASSSAQSSASSSAQTTDSSAQTTDSSASSSAKSSRRQSSSSIPTTISVTTTDANGSTVTSEISTKTFAAVTTPTTSGIVSTETGKGKSNLVVIGGTSTIDRSTLSSATIITSALLAEQTQRSTYTSFYTSDGRVYSSLVTTSRTFSSTTGYATETISPTLANGGGSGDNLSTSSKNIIGGVVGGIGGAILIGGIALVAWRLWRKKERQGAGDEYADSRSDSIAGEKHRSSGGTMGGGPGGFQDNMDAYHHAAGPVNTASNF